MCWDWIATHTRPPHPNPPSPSHKERCRLHLPKPKLDAPQISPSHTCFAQPTPNTPLNHRPAHPIPSATPNNQQYVFAIAGDITPFSRPLWTRHKEQWVPFPRGLSQDKKCRCLYKRRSQPGLGNPCQLVLSPKTLMMRDAIQL